jgi:hypothetical protein
MNGAINDDLAQALGVFFFWFFYARPVRMLSWEIQSSTLEPKGCRRVRSPVFFECRADRIVCLFLFFEVNRCLNIVVPLRGVHSWFAHSTLFQAQLNSCIRLWIHFSFRFCLMEVELDTQWSLRGMSAQRDGSPMKACGTLRSLNSKGSEHALSVPNVERWTMVLGWDGLLTELQMELSPTGALRPCVVFPIGNVNETCYCFFSACKCFLRDCQSIWSKVVCWCNDNDFFFVFVSQVSDREQSVIWNETTLPVMLQCECIC